MVPLRARSIDSDYPLGYVPWASGLMIRIVLALPVEPAGVTRIMKGPRIMLSRQYCGFVRTNSLHLLSFSASIFSLAAFSAFVSTQP